jgi:hypothetical protein
MVDLDRFSRVPLYKAAITNASKDPDENEIAAVLHLKDYGKTNNELTRLEPSQIQGTNKIAMIGSAGAEAMSIIRRYSHDGGIVKKTLSRDGEKAETLLYLPRSTVRDNSSVTLLNPSGDDDWISMVINKSQQETYDFTKCGELGIPAVVMRERSSITPYKSSFVPKIKYKVVSVNKSYDT